MTGLRVAGAIYLVLGIGFGAGAVVTLLHFARHGELPMTPWGFRSMSGPFEGLGAGRFSLLGWSFVGVCALDAVAGIWLWQGRRGGARLGMVTSPLAFILGRFRPADSPRRRTHPTRPDVRGARQPTMKPDSAVQGELDEA